MENKLTTYQRKRMLRYLSKARIHITDVTKEDAELKNLSMTGCCIKCKGQIQLKLHDMYILNVLPEDPAKFEKFELLAESRWLQFREGYSEVGFSLISSPILFSQYRRRCRKFQ